MNGKIIENLIVDTENAKSKLGETKKNEIRTQADTEIINFF